MALVIEQAATMMCPHAAPIQPTPGITRVTIGGMAPLADDDTFVIAGCPFVTGTTPMPCVEVQWLTATTRVTVEGKKLLLDNSTALCKAGTGAPQGAPNIVVTQQRVEAM
jgi:hypothetical protein